MRFIIPPTYLRLLLLFCIYTSTLSLFSQEREIDYDYKKLDSLFWAYRDNNLDASEKYAEIILKKATKENNYTKTAKALLRISLIKKDLQDFKEAHSLIDKAIVIVHEKLKDSSLKSRYLLNKGNIYYAATDYDNALEYYLKSFSYEKKLHNIQNSIDIAHNIAIIRTLTGDFEEAIKIFKDNYVIFSSWEKSQDTNFNSSYMLSTLLAISDSYIELSINQKEAKKKEQFLDSATVYNNIGFHKSQEYKNLAKHNLFLIRDAMISHKKKNYLKAIKDLNIALESAEKIKQSEKFSTIYFHLAKSYQKLEKLDQAILFFKKIDSISHISNQKSPYLQETYLALTDLYVKKKEVENILKYHNLYVEIDNINDQKTIEIRKRIHNNYDIPLLNEKIEELTKTAKKQKSKYSIVLIVLATLAIVFLSFLIYSQRKNRKNRLAFDKLLQELKNKEKDSIHKNEEESKTKNMKSSLSIDEEKVNKILSALEKFEQKKQFLDMNCDLAFVAKKVKTNKAYLSNVIHTQKQQKFIQYITNLRINYALKKLKEDRLFRSYDIKSIAAEIGFKSPDSFSRAFKNKTGIYPSYYIKNLSKINASEEKK